MFRKHIFDNKIRLFTYVSLALFIVIQILTLVSPLIMRDILDNLIPDADTSGIIVATLIMVSLPFIIVILNTVYNYFSIKFARNKGNDIAIDLLDKVVHQKLSFFKKQNSMELVSYLSKEAVTYVSFYIRELPKYIGYIIVAVVTIILMFIYNPLIAAFQVLYIPIAIIPVKLVTKRIDSEIKFIVSKNAVLMQKRSDLIKGIEYIKSNNLERSRIIDIKNENKKIVKTWGRVAALDSLTGFWSIGFVTVLFSGLTFGITSILFTVDSKFAVSSIGVLILLYSYSLLYYNSINSIIQTNLNKKKQEAEFEKLLQFYDLEVTSFSEVVSDNYDQFKALSMKNIYFSYEDKNILNNVSFDVEKGEWVGIVGDSGIGKTTLLNIMIKLYELDKGDYLVNNQNVNLISESLLRTIITKISQDIFLFPGSIYDNFMIVNSTLTENDIFKYLEISKLSSFVNKLPNGLHTDIGEMGKLISGGEKQRLSLAIGLSRDTDVILLDEITANLDPNVEKEIMNNLIEWKKSNKKTIISVSHRESFHNKCDSIITLN